MTHQPLSQGSRRPAADLAQNLAQHAPRVREIAPLLEGLAETCAVGEGALQAVGHGRPCSADWRREKLAALTQAGQPKFAVELMILAPLRKLVCAAAAESQRAALAPEAWRQRVEQAAAIAYGTGT